MVAVVFACWAAASGWGSKAVSSERAASQAVGGFSDLDRRLYHEGLRHIARTQQKVGSFTIAQVVRQERVREETRGIYVPDPARAVQVVVGVIPVFLFLVGLAVLGLRYVLNPEAKHAAPIASAGGTTTAALDPAVIPLRPIRPRGVVPQDGEVFYWEALGEFTQLVRTYERGSSGLSVPIGPVYARIGASRGGYAYRPVRGHGRLLLSDVRLIFITDRGNTAFVGYKRIIAVDEMSATEFRVSITENVPFTFRIRDPRTVHVLRRMIAGDFE
jgi:hypothetical protein